jgi:hypothetical protein
MLIENSGANPLKTSFDEQLKHLAIYLSNESKIQIAKRTYIEINESYVVGPRSSTTWGELLQWAKSG